MTIRRMISVVTVAAVAVTAYLFLWGRLFVFSPVILGFDRHELANTVVYVQRGAAFDDFSTIDGLLPGVEAFHGLTFKRKPVVFIFRDQASFDRRSVSRARFCAFPNGTLVVAPRALDEARRGEISLQTYLTHELSHVLLYQHMSLLRAYSYPRWLLEGVAMCGADQMGTSWYPGETETYTMIAKGNFMPPEDYATNREDDVMLEAPARVAFIYSEFGCLVEHLIRKYGRDAFFGYMTALFDDSDHDRVFSDTFGIDFEQALDEFRIYAGEKAAGGE